MEVPRVCTGDPSQFQWFYCFAGAPENFSLSSMIANWGYFMVQCAGVQGRPRRWPNIYISQCVYIIRNTTDKVTVNGYTNNVFHRKCTDFCYISMRNYANLNAIGVFSHRDWILVLLICSFTIYSYKHNVLVKS